MAKYILGFNFHQMACPAGGASYIEGGGFPEEVTLGFRRVFWRTFTEVHEYKFSDQAFRFFDHTWRIRYVALFISNNATEALGFADARNIFAALHIETEQSNESVDLDAEMFKRGLNEQQFVSEFIASVGPVDQPGVLTSLRHSRGFPGKFQLPVDDYNLKSSVLATIATFNFYFLLMLWQTEREQIAIDLAQNDGSISEATQLLFRQRTKLINMERLFLTTNVSNRTEVKRLLKAARDRFHVRGRFERLQRVNEGMERFFEIRTQALLQSQSRNLNRIAIALAFLGLPLTLMSMLLALTAKTDIVIRPIPIISAANVQIFFFLSILLSTLLLASVVGAIALRHTSLFRDAMARLPSRPARK